MSLRVTVLRGAGFCRGGRSRSRPHRLVRGRAGFSVLTRVLHGLEPGSETVMSGTVGIRIGASGERPSDGPKDPVECRGRGGAGLTGTC